MALEEVCEVFADGDWVESKDQSPEGIRLIQTGNVGEGFFKNRSERARYISEETFERLRCTEVFEGDCLISRLPDPVGRSCLLPHAEQRMITAVDCTIARFDRDRLLPEFFCLISQTYEFLQAVDAETTGTTRKRISRRRLGQVKIPVPPLQEQQRITAVLSEAFDAISAAAERAARNRENATALFEGYLRLVFATHKAEWRRRPLGAVAEVQSGGTPLVSRKDYWGGPIPWYSSGELNDTFTTDADRTITAEGLSGSNAKLHPKGSLLIGMYDTAALKMSILDREAAFNQAVAGVKPNDRIDNEFVLHAINARRPEILLERRGVRQKNLSLKKIKSISIPVPDLPEQRRVVAQLREYREETRRLESSYVRRAIRLEELKKSLLHEALEGQLRMPVA